MTEKGWLDRQLNLASEEVKTWPKWMRQEAGLEPKKQKPGASQTQTEKEEGQELK